MARVADMRQGQAAMRCYEVRRFSLLMVIYSTVQQPPRNLSIVPLPVGEMVMISRVRTYVPMDWTLPH